MVLQHLRLNECDVLLPQLCLPSKMLHHHFKWHSTSPSGPFIYRKTGWCHATLAPPLILLVLLSWVSFCLLFHWFLLVESKLFSKLLLAVHKATPLITVLYLYSQWEQKVWYMVFIDFNWTINPLFQLDVKRTGPTWSSLNQKKKKILKVMVHLGNNIHFYSLSLNLDHLTAEECKCI